MPLMVGITSVLEDRAACSVKGAAPAAGAQSNDVKGITLNIFILGNTACKQQPITAMALAICYKWAYTRL